MELAVAVVLCLSMFASWLALPASQAVAEQR
jgi:hypothetical protein